MPYDATYNDADYLDEYGDNIEENYTIYDEMDNGAIEKSAAGTKISSPSFLDSFKKSAGGLLDFALKVAPTALEFINAGKGTPQPVAQNIQATPKNPYPEMGQAAAISKQKYLPWILGGVGALVLGVIVFFVARKK